jgi:hypothetical protein
MAPTDPKEPPMTATTEAPASAVADAVLNPELVVQQAGEDAATAAINAAVTEAATLPGVPGRDEFMALAMQARILSMSGAAPKAVRGNPYVAFHVAMVGRDLGISPSAALELIDIIEGGGQYRLSLSPQLLNGQIRRLGLGSIVPLVQRVDYCLAVALAPHGHADVRCGPTWPDHIEDCRCHGILGSTEFSWEEAQMAGLAMRDCKPGEHTVKCLNRNTSSWEKCNQGYVTYPKRMMWWRAGGYCADDWFPEAGLGLYSPEELGAVVDVDGRPIDPTSVELPEGYQPKAPEPVAMADDRTVAELRHVINALPPDGRQALVAKWTDGQAEGNPYLQPLGKAGEPTKLPERQVKKAWAVVDHIAQRAAKGEWGAWERPEPLPPVQDSGEAPPEQAGGSAGPEVPAPPAAPSSSPANAATPEEPDTTQADHDAADAAARADMERALATPTTDQRTARPAPVAEPETHPEDDAELEAIAQAYEALTDHQRAWLTAAIAKEGLRQDQLQHSAEARATFKALVAGAAMQPATPPQDAHAAPEAPPAPDTADEPAEATTVDLAARVAEIAAKAKGGKAPKQDQLLPE